MIEEISSDNQCVSNGDPYIDELLAKHFGRIEEKIRSADSRERAQEIVDNTISNFKKECLSETLREFLKYDMNALIEKYWKTVPNNL